MIVRKAVIPAAGKGSRMLPISKTIPKEMMPIGTRPILHYIIEEATSAGIEELAIIINSEKSSIKKYFVTSGDPLNDEDRNLRRLVRNVRIRFIEQKEHGGVADALSKASKFIGDEPFAYLLPDNFSLASPPFLKQLISPFQELQKNLIGLIEVHPTDEGMFGNNGRVELESIKSKLYSIKRLYDKRPGSFPVDPAGLVIRAFARGILLPSFFEIVEEYRGVTKGELDDVPIMQHLVQNNDLFGYLMEGKGFDTGHPTGYLMAAQAFFSQEY